MSGAVMLAAWLQAAGLVGASPPGSSRFGAGVDIVHVSVSVTGKRGRAVTDLERTAFTVFEDGTPQTLSLFAREDVALSLVLLIDCSDSMRAKLPMAQAAARAFVHTLRPGDTAELVQFSRAVRVAQDFTGDRPTLETAIAGLATEGATALYDAIYVALKDLARRGEPGKLQRLAVVLLSDGQDTVSGLTEDQVLEAARRSDAAVYAVGLPLGAPGSSARDVDGPRVTYFLSTLARETGGRSYFPKEPEELQGVYTTIATELRTRYSLAYVPRAEVRDGRWHRLTVQVSSRQDLRIRHKPGYFAPRSEGPPAGR